MQALKKQRILRQFALVEAHIKQQGQRIAALEADNARLRDELERASR